MQKTNFNMKIETLTIQVDISQPLTENVRLFEKNIFSNWNLNQFVYYLHPCCAA